MSNQINQIQNKIFSKKDNFTIVDTMIRVMETFGYTLDELRNMPLPTYEYVVQYLNKLDTVRAKQYKKK